MGSGGSPSAPPPTASEKELARSGAQGFNDSQKRFVPLQNSFMKDAQTTQGERDMVSGETNADFAQASKTGARDIATTAFARGGYARAANDLNTSANDTASTVGNAQARAVQGADNAELKAYSKIAAFGHGLQDNANISLRSAARNEVGLALTRSKAKFREQQQLRDAAGAMAGALASKHKTDIKNFFKAKKNKTPAVNSQGLTPDGYDGTNAFPED